MHTTVTPGQSLWTIAKGSLPRGATDAELTSAVRQIAAANGLRPNAKLRVGQTLTIPDAFAGIGPSGATLAEAMPRLSAGSTPPRGGAVAARIAALGGGAPAIGAQARHALDAMKATLNAREAAESSMDYLIAQSDAMKQAALAAKALGFQVGELEYDDQSHLLWFELGAGTVTGPTAELLGNLAADGLRLAIGAYDSSSANGAFVDDKAMVFVSPEHLLLGTDLRTTTLLHEMLHAHHAQDVAAGRPSPYDAQLEGDEGAEVTGLKVYGSFLSFDELATWTNDVGLLAQGVPAIEVVQASSTLQEVLESKRAGVQEIAEAIPRIAARAAHALEAGGAVSFLDDPARNQVPCARLRYIAEDGSTGTLSVWLPELAPRRVADCEDQELRAALKAKLEAIRAHAASQGTGAT